MRARSRSNNSKPRPGARLAGSHPAVNSLVTCWTFNEGGGGIVRDCRNINHGSFTQGTPKWAAPFGIIGPSVALKSTDSDQVSCASARDLPVGATAAWAVEVWAKMNSTSSLAGVGGFGALTSNAGNDPAGSGRSLIQFGGSSPNFHIYFWGSAADWDTGVLWKTDGQWHQYIITTPGGSSTPTLYLLIDGVQVASGTPGASLTTALTKIGVGGGWVGNAPSFDGQVGLLRIYKSDIRWLAPQIYRNPWGMFAMRQTALARLLALLLRRRRALLAG